MKVLFYTDVTWSLGTIHNQLVKEFYAKGIYANLLNWDVAYSAQELHYLNTIYDVFVTLPGTQVTRLIEGGIPPEKIVAIAHGRYDVMHGTQANNPWDKLRKIGGVSPDVAQTYRAFGHTFPVSVVQNGIDFNLFYRPVAERLERLGYFGSDFAMDVLDNNKDCKRKYIAETIAENTNLPLIGTGGKLVNLCMSALYNNIDALIMPSSGSEACGLPYMEAAAAGRLPISAPVGIVHHLSKPAGLVMRLEDEGFINQAVIQINELKENHSRFTKLCKEAQDFAREYYDWSVVIDGWIETICN
jgi:hypothetical protein